MTTKAVFESSKMRTHMPFCDGKHLVFCASADVQTQQFECGGTIWNTLRAKPWLRERFVRVPRSTTVQYRLWRLYYSPWNEGRMDRLVTGMPSNAVECSPAFFFDDKGQLHVSFIGGIPSRRGLVYHLYEMAGPSFAELGQPTKLLEEPTIIGFGSSRYLCFSRRGEVILRKRDTGGEVGLKLPFVHVQRASFHADDPEKLLITGANVEATPQTIVHDLSSGETYELSSAEGAYKPTVFGGQMVFAKKEDGGFEDCALRQAAPMLNRSAIRVQRSAAAVN